MNQPNDNWLDAVPCEDELWMQSLVDGELDERQRARYIAWLAETDSHWKSCAIRLLESQSTRADLLAIRESSAPRRLSPAEQVAPVVAKHSSRTTGWLALVATSLLAFFGGFWLGQDESTTPQAHVPVRIENHLPEQQPTLVQVAPDDRDAPTSPQPDPINEWDELTLVMTSADKPDEASRVTLPIIPANSNGTELLNWRSDVPEHVMQAMERTGHRLERSKSHVPVQMTDGRQIVVPVEDLRLVRNERFEL